MVRGAPLFSFPGAGGVPREAWAERFGPSRLPARESSQAGATVGPRGPLRQIGRLPMLGPMAEQTEPKGVPQDPAPSSVTAPGPTILVGGEPLPESTEAKLGKGSRVRYCYRPNGFPQPIVTTATIERVYKPKKGDTDQRRYADLQCVFPCGKAGKPELRERLRVVESELVGGKLKVHEWAPEIVKPAAPDPSAEGGAGATG